MIKKEILPCCVEEDDFPEDTKNNCIFLIPEQFGGDETNRPTFCLLKGYEFKEHGCIFRKTKEQLMTTLRKERV